MKCEDCDGPMSADATGELRCGPCDRSMERMAQGMREDAITEGKSVDEVAREWSENPLLFSASRGKYAR